MYFSELLLYKARQEVNTWVKCSLDERTVVVHPKFNEYADSGFDIALCRQVNIDTVEKNLEYCLFSNFSKR